MTHDMSNMIIQIFFEYCYMTFCQIHTAYMSYVAGGRDKQEKVAETQRVEHFCSSLLSHLLEKPHGKNKYI